MTFAELQRGVFDDMQYQAQPKPGVQERVRRYLNEGLERVLRRPRLRSLRLGKFPFVARAEQGFYGIPPALERIDYLIDTTNGRKLAFRTRDWYRSIDPAMTSSGTPAYWIAEGIGPVRRQPRLDDLAITKVWARSEGPDDITQKVFIRLSYEGRGSEREYLQQLNGTTPVLLNSPPVGLGGSSEISALSLDATTVHEVWITDHVDPLYAVDALAMIRPGTLSTRYLGIRLVPTPSSALVYEAEGQRVVPVMVLDHEEPPFPADFHEMLCCYARARFYRKDGRLQQSQLEMAEFERYALDLTAFVEYPVSYKPVAGKLSPGTHGWSDLGPWYPADRSGGWD